LLDLSGDGRMDVYVANDREANFAWIQNPDGTFTDKAPEMGIALNAYGGAEASMGVAVGDFNGDLEADLFMTNLFQETNTIYLTRGPGRYQDATLEADSGRPASTSPGSARRRSITTSTATSTSWWSTAGSCVPRRGRAPG